MHKAVLGLGSNLGSPNENIKKAVELINNKIGNVTITSSYIETEPLLHPDTPTYGQANYCNMVLVVDTSLSPMKLLVMCQDIERKLGRCRETETTRWTPRFLDVDIIAIEELTVNTDKLIIPHTEMHKRAFVLDPFHEIWPEWRHPILGKTAKQLAKKVNGHNYV